MMVWAVAGGGGSLVDVRMNAVVKTSMSNSSRSFPSEYNRR